MTPEHLAQQVKRLCDRSPETRIVGLHAERWLGGESIAVDGAAFSVRWCVSPLAISEQLSALSEGDRLIVLTPLAHADLSLDVLSRFARRQLLHPDKWQLVRDAYGVAAVDPRLPMQSWMADALLSARPQMRTARANTLDADTAWGHLFRHHLGLPSGNPDVESIISWSTDPSTEGRFDKLAAPLAEAVKERLRYSVGGVGNLLAEGIASGHSSELLPIGLVCGVLFDAGSNNQDPALAQAAARLEPLLGGSSVEPARGREWAAASRTALRSLSQDQRSEWLNRAESLLTDLKADAFSERSSVLPSGFQSRLARFATATTAALQKPRALESAEDAFRRVREHVAFDELGDRARHLEMAMRLVRSFHQTRKSARELTRMMAHHMEDGAFEDWARRHLLGGDEHPDVSAMFGALYHSVRARREDRNRSFAKAVQRRRTGGASTDMVPIENCLTRIVVPLAKTRPVLVLVLDGMDAGVFHEIGESLAVQGWRRQRGPGPDAVLAVLPTVTECSRMALLSGEVTQGSSATEKPAFAKHPGLMGVSRPNRPPLLFHKGDLSEGAAEGLAAPVREALGNAQRRVVAVVLNAVDDHLSKSEQMQIAWRVDSIKLLPTILMEAHKAGRAVVITSDHGHVLEANGVKLPGDGEGRWRSAASPATEPEIEIGGARVRAATGQERIVLPWSEAVRYGSKRNGYHGGVTLQEAVVPVGVFVGPGEALDGWEPAPLVYPPWWTEEEPQPAHVRLPVVELVEPVPSAAPQPDLFTEAERDRTAAAARWDRLFTSEVFAAQNALAAKSAPDDDAVRAALDALYEANGRLPVLTLAKMLGAAPSHARRAISGLQRLLNVDGYPVLRLSADAEHVELDATLLIERFGLKP